MKDTRRKVRKAMTNHVTGTRKKWLAARLKLLKAEKELTPRWQISSEGARSSSFTTSCSGPTTRQGARPARRSRTGSTAVTWRGDEGAVVFAAMSGTDAATYTRERPGMITFALEDGIVYHAYSTYARGLDGLWGMYQWLDRAPWGRNETGVWWRRHDEYDRK